MVVQNVEVHLLRLIVTILRFISLRSAGCDSNTTVEMHTARLERGVKLVVVVRDFKHAVVHSRRWPLRFSRKSISSLRILILCALHTVDVLDLLHLAKGRWMHENLGASFLLLAR